MNHSKAIMKKIKTVIKKGDIDVKQTKLQGIIYAQFQNVKNLMGKTKIKILFDTY